MSIKHTLPFLLGLAAVTPAMACAPTPSCWIEEGPAYLRDVCADYAKDHKTLAQIAPYLDAPEQIGAFAKACAKVHVHLKAGEELSGAKWVSLNIGLVIRKATFRW